jgi:phosphatidylglycerol lysyltransferase
VVGFVTFVPIFGKGWGLDLMRRGGDAPNGLMEFLIASAALQFQSEGAGLLSLGLSPLAGAEPDPAESEMIARGRQLLYQRFNLFYGFKGLHAFKEKFGPRWEPRYMIYPGETALAQTVYAIIRAHSPRGLWTFIRR